MLPIGRSLIVAGVGLAVVGMILIVWSKLGLPSRLPGDIVLRRGSFTFYFPLATSIVLSILLTLILNLIFCRR